MLEKGDELTARDDVVTAAKAALAKPQLQSEFYETGVC